MISRLRINSGYESLSGEKRQDVLLTLAKDECISTKRAAQAREASGQKDGSNVVYRIFQ